MQTDAREEACSRFIDGAGLAYIKVAVIDGTRTCILCDEDGDEIAMSGYGMVPLISYAINRGMTICSLQ